MVVTSPTNVRTARAHGDESKPSWKTTELAVYLVAVIGVLTASQAVGDGAADNGGDYFAADKAWWYITLLTPAYLVSRGLAEVRHPRQRRGSCNRKQHDLPASRTLRYRLPELSSRVSRYLHRRTRGAPRHREGTPNLGCRPGRSAAACRG